MAWNQEEPITALANTWQSQKRCEVPYIWHHKKLPRRCFFQNFNSIQIFGNFLQNATNPSSSILATNNLPACIFILSCTIPTKNLHLVQLNEALPFRTRPLLQQLLEYQNRPSMGDARILHWTLPTGFTVDSCEGFFFGGSLQKKEWIIRAHCRLGFWTPPKIYIFCFQSQCILDDFQILALNLIGTWNSRWTKNIIHQK